MLTQPTNQNSPYKMVSRTAPASDGQAPEAISGQERSGSNANSSPTEVQRNQLTLRIDKATASSLTFADLVKQLSDIVVEETQCLSLWVSLPEEDGQFQKFRCVTDHGEDPLWPIAGPTVELAAHAAVETGETCSLSMTPIRQVAVVPVRDAGNPTQRPVALWTGCFETVEQTALRQQWLLSMVGLATATWFQNRKLATSVQTAAQLADAVNCVNSLGQATDLTHMGISLTNQLRKSFAARQVAIAIGENARALSLLAISDVEHVDLDTASTKCLKLACIASGELGKPVVWPNESPDAGPETHALREYCDTHQSEAAISIPLQLEGGELVGTLLIAVDKSQLQSATCAENFLRMAGLIAGQLAVSIRANRSVTQLAFDQLRQLKQANWARYAAAAAVIVSLLMCVPLPHRVPCECTVQPVQRRFVSAPYDGILEESVVKAGDVVVAGQLLATMDGANLRSELSGLKADLAAAQQRRDSALAQGEVAQSQIARSEMKRHLSKVDIIRHQLSDLEIRSPIDGIVVNGDLEKVLGAPLEMGQTVFEVAPLEKMLADIEIDESEIQYVRVGMPVKIKLNAFPFRSWSGELKRIHPGTELIDGESVFVAEVELPNSELQLRPGMKGSAKIRGDLAPLGWSLFHQPWEAVRYWTIW